MNTMMRMRGRRAGFSLIEAMVSTFIFLAFLAAVYQAVNRSRQFADVQETLSVIQVDGEKALNRMAEELRMSAHISNPIAGEPAYPYVFVNGEAYDSFAAESHTPPDQHVGPGSPGFGEVREIVFKVPFDNDGNGLFTDEDTGQPEWSTFDVSYVVITDASGTNVLVRRQDGVATDIIAKFVERVTFDTVNTDAVVGFSEIVITIYMAKPLSPGVWVETNLSTCITMRNVEEV